MEPDAAALQAQLDQFRGYFRDHAGQIELLAESADALLRMMATYVLMDLTLERHVLTVSDRQFERIVKDLPAPDGLLDGAGGEHIAQTSAALRPTTT